MLEFYNTLNFASLDMQNFLNPLQIFNAALVLFSNQQVACKSSLRIKQFQTRVSSFSGFFDLAFTIGYGYYNQDMAYTYLQNIMALTAADTCENWGFQIS